MPCPVALVFVRLPPVSIGDDEDNEMPVVPSCVIVTFSKVGFDEVRLKPFPVLLLMDIVLFLIAGEAEVMVIPVLY